MAAAGGSGKCAGAASLARLERTLARERVARREAELQVQARDELLVAVSHELRTPLSAVLGWSLIARRHSPRPDVMHAISVIERNALAQLRILEDVLDAGRIAVGKLRLEISIKPVGSVLEQAVLTVRPSVEAKQLQLELTIPGDLGAIAADHDRLRQIVWNLLSNAVKFTPVGGHITLSARRLSTGIEIEVRDSGQGIGPALLPHVFEPFRQADGSTTRRHQGLGLGLAIVKQLVRAHGGQVFARSAGEGKGATFTVRLPAHPPQPGGRGPRRTQPSQAVAAAPDVRLDGLRLLLVDDDDDSREFVAFVLADRGATVVSARSAPEALKLFERRSPDLLLSDIGMPEVSGYSLMRQIRARPALRGGRTPAIALTAYARPVDGQRALAAGFHAHVTKPVDPERLTAVVAQLARPARKGG